ncbi:MAG: hypothetical protein Q4D85_11320 [Corynebacterium sp.]|uniref:Uncharacterized protein n=1 Tax=Corynebacterium mustelae TaxID=571915 RepID=A0A0G3GXG0_9CORY|nr:MULTISPECIES: hypothetical protein [Corynebacterium]AKK05205.1 hypothetical protein CMUST_04315 [Corynebacterium mustelae]AKK07469.1 hypothetical protein CMUST_15905 [Corynebacterium mustelae]MDO5099325.1 hypothetical protein [Corynebacterium sp.]
MQKAPRYRFRPGALDHIMRSRNLTTDEQLAACIGVNPDDITQLRAGAEVTPRVALKVATIQGDPTFISGYFDLVNDPLVAA